MTSTPASRTGRASWPTPTEAARCPACAPCAPRCSTSTRTSSARPSRRLLPRPRRPPTPTRQPPQPRPGGRIYLAALAAWPRRERGRGQEAQCPCCCLPRAAARRPAWGLLGHLAGPTGSQHSTAVVGIPTRTAVLVQLCMPAAKSAGGVRDEATCTIRRYLQACLAKTTGNLITKKTIEWGHLWSM